MVFLKPIVLRGTIDQTLKYPLGQIENIQEGEWQLSLISVSFIYDNKNKHPAEIPRKVLKVTSNYVLTTDINERSEKITVQAPLAVLRYGAAHASVATIGFRSQLCYTINNPEQELSIKFITIDTNTMTSGASVFLYLVLKRVR